MSSTIDQHIAAPVEPATSTAARVRRTLMLTVLAIAGVASVFWAYRTWTYARAHESTDNAQVDGHVVPVLARVGGYVKSISVNENDVARAGQVLVQLDDAEYRERAAQAEAELAAAEAATGAGGVTGQAQALVSTAENQEASLKAQIEAARANDVRAQADLARSEELAARQIISRQQLDALRASAAAARANVVSLEKQASAAGSSISSAQAGVRLAQARLAAARAMRNNAALQVEYTRITAPESGTIARKSVEVGQLVQPGQPLMSVVADSGIWITANFKETQLADMRVGQTAEIEIDAYGNCHAEGRIQSISSATGAKFALLPPDNATGNFTKVVQRIPVRILITRDCGAEHPFRPGMSATVSVETL